MTRRVPDIQPYRAVGVGAGMAGVVGCLAVGLPGCRAAGLMPRAAECDAGVTFDAECDCSVTLVARQAGLVGRDDPRREALLSPARNLRGDAVRHVLEQSCG